MWSPVGDRGVCRPARGPLRGRLLRPVRRGARAAGLPPLAHWAASGPSGLWLAQYQAVAERSAGRLAALGGRAERRPQAEPAGPAARRLQEACAALGESQRPAACAGREEPPLPAACVGPGNRRGRRCRGSRRMLLGRGRVRRARAALLAGWGLAGALARRAARVILRLGGLGHPQSVVECGGRTGAIGRRDDGQHCSGDEKRRSCHAVLVPRMDRCTPVP